MAEGQSAELEEDVELLNVVDGFQLMPYQFEPEYAADERRNAEQSDSSSDEEPDEVDLDTLRVGNSNWCTCALCGPMPTPRESLCCRELRELDDKKSEEAIGNCH